MKTTKTILLLMFLTLGLTAAGCNPSLKQPSNSPVIMKNNYSQKLNVKDRALYVEIVRDQDSMAAGLSGRDKMADDQGMLFDYEPGANELPIFWMKGMKFNLDIIWIKNHKIIGITKNVPAPKDSQDVLPTYSPSSPIDMVLEVNARWVNKNNIAIGDNVTLMQN